MPRRVDADVTVLLDEQLRCGVELSVQGVGAECRARKSGTTYHHAVQSEVNGFLPKRADYVVLEVVKGDRFIADNELAEVEEADFRQAAKTLGTPASTMPCIANAL